MKHGTSVQALYDHPRGPTGKKLKEFGLVYPPNSRFGPVERLILPYWIKWYRSGSVATSFPESWKEFLVCSRLVRFAECEGVTGLLKPQYRPLKIHHLYWVPSNEYLEKMLKAVVHPVLTVRGYLKPTWWGHLKSATFCYSLPYPGRILIRWGIRPPEPEILIERNYGKQQLKMYNPRSPDYLTPKQKVVHRFIINHLKEKNEFPALEDISKEFGFKISSVERMLSRIRGRGLLNAYNKLEIPRRRAIPGAAPILSQRRNGTLVARFNGSGKKRIVRKLTDEQGNILKLYDPETGEVLHDFTKPS